ARVRRTRSDVLRCTARRCVHAGCHIPKPNLVSPLGTGGARCSDGPCGRGSTSSGEAGTTVKGLNSASAQDAGLGDRPSPRRPCAPSTRIGPTLRGACPVVSGPSGSCPMDMMRLILFAHVAATIGIFAALTIEWVGLKHLGQATSYEQAREWARLWRF